jgi:pimeloyl-ACP methyl ester carboxylesterase
MTAYRSLLATWPVEREDREVRHRFGTTPVFVNGRADGPPLVLMHGGGATATVWHRLVGPLGRIHRVFTVERDVGATETARMRTADDLITWTDEVLAGLGLDRVALCGHSFGAWMSLIYALRRADRVSRVVLLDPTTSFAPFSKRAAMVALPLLLRPSPARMARYLAWETRGAALDPEWLAVTTAATRHKAPRYPFPKPPPASAFRGWTGSTNIVFAERSRLQDTAAALARARKLIPHATITTLAGATHHTIPTEHTDALIREIAA